MWIKRAIIFLPATAIALYLSGRWFQSLYGLDPPYAYLYIGLLMQLAAVGLAIVAAILVVVACIKLRKVDRL